MKQSQGPLGRIRVLEPTKGAQLTNHSTNNFFIQNPQSHHVLGAPVLRQLDGTSTTIPCTGTATRHFDIKTLAMFFPTCITNTSSLPRRSCPRKCVFWNIQDGTFFIGCNASDGSDWDDPSVWNEVECPPNQEVATPFLLDVFLDATTAAFTHP